LKAYFALRLCEKSKKAIKNIFRQGPTTEKKENKIFNNLSAVAPLRENLKPIKLIYVMRNLITMILFCILSCFSYAQKIVEKHLGCSPGKKVEMNIQIADSIRIIAWNKNEVYAKASIEINKNKDNDIYVTEFNESGNTVEIIARFDDAKKDRGYNDSCRCCCNYRSKIYWDVYIPENAAFSVESIDGNIIINGKTDEIKAHTISGFIDLVFPSSRKADLKMSTISGTIYTNLALAKPKGGRDGNEVSSEYNGGGKRVELETISGDIFLRKAE
jgi:Putative adhesin